MALNVVLLLVGFAGLVLGGEGLVRGAVGLAKRLGIPPLIIGLTVVSLGTSAPELVVSVIAGVQGQSNIAIANVVGSNIFNILIVLGVPAIIRPLQTSGQLLRREVPILIGVSLLTVAMAMNGLQIGRLEAAVLVLGLAGFLALSYRVSQQEPDEILEEAEAFSTKTQPIGVSLGLLAVGITLLIAGGRLSVVAAVAIASSLGISDTVIGLTVIAIGTSLPELVTSVVATYRGQADIAVGNALGSNIFNLLGILGLAGLIRPLNVDPSLISYDFPCMIAAAVILIPLIITKRRITRLEGSLLVLLYVLYTAGLLVRTQA